MKSLSVRVPDDTHERIAERANERGTSLSAEARELIVRGLEADEVDEELAELRERLESREQRIDDLEEQLARRSQIEEKVDVLAERVEDSQLTYAERRQRMIDEASLGQRLRWKVTGVPVDEDGES